jgi:hypothetical protein
MVVDGRRDIATYALQKSLAADGGVADAHLPAAHIALAGENPQAADAALEQAPHPPYPTFTLPTTILCPAPEQAPHRPRLRRR